jgi:hypothetical protein
MRDPQASASRSVQHLGVACLLLVTAVIILASGTRLGQLLGAGLVVLGSIGFLGLSWRERLR